MSLEHAPAGHPAPEFIDHLRTVLQGPGIAAPPVATLPLVMNNTVSNAAIDSKSIAVLPFEDLSPARDQEHFSDGLAEAVIDLLTQVPDIRVIARTSSFSFKGARRE